MYPYSATISNRPARHITINRHVLTRGEQRYSLSRIFDAACQVKRIDKATVQQTGRKRATGISDVVDIVAHLATGYSHRQVAALLHRHRTSIVHARKRARIRLLDEVWRSELKKVQELL